MMKVGDVVSFLEDQFPLSWQESYDNCGLLIGNKESTITGVLVSLDCTEEVVDEALSNGANLIVSHHPLIFSGLKKITGFNLVERVVIKAIQNNIALYALHTNYDHSSDGVSYQIATKLGLNNIKTLKPIADQLLKLTTFVPLDFHNQVLQALFEAGAGHIGNYDSCSFNIQGEGTFRANEKANPFIGKANELRKEKENRIELILPQHKLKSVLKALFASHPYEEVAYDIVSLKNTWQNVGAGVYGEFDVALSQPDFLNLVKNVYGGTIKYTAFKKNVRRVGLCGGTGFFLLNDAIQQNCDAYITSDIKYHQFFDADNQLMLIDVGHFEAEILSLSFLVDLLERNFTTFAVRLAKSHTNPVNYL
jgi:dinuclear metal center YbgI/SA1388 family protein